MPVNDDLSVYLTCDKLVERLQPVLDKRQRAKLLAEQRRQQQDDSWDDDTDTDDDVENWDSNDTTPDVSVTETTQSKVKESKVKNSNKKIADRKSADPLKQISDDIVKKQTKQDTAQRNNELISIVKNTLEDNWFAYKMDRKFERARANLFFKSKDFLQLCTRYNCTPPQLVQAMMLWVVKDKWWWKQVTNTVDLYDNYAKIHNSVKINVATEQEKSDSARVF